MRSMLQRQNAIQKIPELLGPDPLTLGVGEMDQVIPLPPERQRYRDSMRELELERALATAAPEQYMTGLMSERFAQPDNTRSGQMMAMLERLGLEPTLDNVTAVSQAMRGGGGGGMDPRESLLLDLQIKEQIASLQQMGAEDSERQESKRQKRLAEEDAINGMANTLMRINDSNNALAGNLLISPGAGMLEERRMGAQIGGAVGDFFGVDTGLTQDVENFDQLRKDSAILKGEMLKAMQASGITVTRDLQALVDSQVAGDDLSSGANKAVLKVMVDNVIKQAQNKNISINNIKGLQRLRRELAGTTFEFATQSEAQAAANAGAISEGETVIIGGETWQWSNN
ncbi:MAG: hypothetical protein AAF529_16560 [Pseudomonadota bacterium]